MNITEKILKAHLVEGEMKTGNTILVKMDQTLTQDALGMISYLTFEQMGLDRVQTELSVSYLDHNMLYSDNRNPDDHEYLKTIASKYGLYLSRAGNGICHSVHMARFSKPGKTLIGTDSHTPSAGAVGMLGLGAGGLEVSAVLAGDPVEILMPEVINIELTGSLKAGVNVKDAALMILKKLTVKGATNAVIEYSGEGIDSLSIPERMTLCNLGAEAGATSSIFPSDEKTKAYFDAQERPDDWSPIKADEDAVYSRKLTIDLTELEPMVALPHLPDNVVRVSEAGEVKLDQIFIGSCTNSSFSDMMKAAEILKGRKISKDVSLLIGPGTRQNYQMLAESGALEIFIGAGARILECGCGPCIGIGQAVRTGGSSLRTINRNFKGRCGTKDSYVYISSPETAAASAVTGRLTAASELMDVSGLLKITEPERYPVDDSLIIAPEEGNRDTEIYYGPNIKPIPVLAPLPDSLSVKIAGKYGDNISTDDISPAGQKNVGNRANVPLVSESTFERMDPDFCRRAREYQSSIIVAGENYGQGSSREHAALQPMYLGVKAVLAKSFARIHKANLVNFGLLPMSFENPDDYEKMDEGDELELSDLKESLKAGRIAIQNRSKNMVIYGNISLSKREKEVILAGGRLPYIRQRKG